MFDFIGFLRGVLKVAGKVLGKVATKVSVPPLKGKQLNERRWILMRNHQRKPTATTCQSYIKEAPSVEIIAKRFAINKSDNGGHDEDGRNGEDVDGLHRPVGGQRRCHGRRGLSARGASIERSGKATELGEAPAPLGDAPSAVSRQPVLTSPVIPATTSVVSNHPNAMWPHR